jgi:RHS repeat-associated protein
MTRRRFRSFVVLALLALSTVWLSPGISPAPARSAASAVGSHAAGSGGPANAAFPAGATAGATNASASSSGDYQTAVPIAVPPYHGLQPRLSLAYNSSGRNAWLGVGWQLSGLSSIRRTSPGRGAPNYDNDDVYYLDGAELVPCTAGMQSPSCKYRASPAYLAYTTKIESFQRIAFDPSMPGGEWFVWNTTGTKMTYEPRTYNAASGVFTWVLKQVEDTLGNKLSYVYWYDSFPPTPGEVFSLGEQYLDRIEYNGTILKFYPERRPDAVTYAVGRDLVHMRYRLKSIDVTVGGSRARTYELTYASSSSSGSSLLKSVQQFGTDATVCTNAASTTCSYGAVIGGTSRPATTFVAASMTATASRWAADVTDAAGVDDPVAGTGKYASTLDASIQLTGPLGGGGGTQTADVNGDGRSDDIVWALDRDCTTLTIATVLAARSGPPIQAIASQPWSAAGLNNSGNTCGGTKVYAADIDGNGQADLLFDVLRKDYPNDIGNYNYTSYLLTAVSNGDGTFTQATGHPNGRPDPTLPQVAWNHNIANEAYEHCAVGDVNGDGNADFVCTHLGDALPPTYQPQDGWYVGTALSQGDGTFAVVNDPITFEYGVPPDVTVGDVNGDGLDDMLFIDTQTKCDEFVQIRWGCTLGELAPHRVLMTGISKGRGTFTWERQETDWTYGFGPGDPGTPTTLFAADLNGDGNADYLLHRRQGDAEVFFTAVSYANLPAGRFRLHAQAGPQLEGRITPGDYNGDGKADLMVAAYHAAHSGDGCSVEVDYDHIALSRVSGNGDGTFSFPNNWHDCATSTDTNWHWNTALEASDNPRPADVNGDGRADFVGSWNGGREVRANISLNTTNDLSNWRRADITGDGRDDLVYVYFTNPGYVIRTRMSAANGGFTAQSQPFTGSQIPLDNPNTVGWTLMDTGSPSAARPDGRADLVYVDDNRADGLSIFTLMSNGDGTWTPRPVQTFGPLASGAFAKYTARHWLPMDVNGDGRLDLVHVFVRWGTAYVNTLLSKGDGTWSPPSLSTPFAGLRAAERDWRPMEVNGDGKMDLALVTIDAGKTTVRTLLSKGDGTWTPITDTPAASAGESLDPKFDNTRNWKPMEVNGDGMTDLGHLEYLNPGVRLRFLLSTGDGQWQSGSTPSISLPAFPVRYEDTRNFRAMDVNRDGKTDLVHVSTYSTNGSDALNTAVVLLSNNYPRWTADTQTAIQFQSEDVGNWRDMDFDGDGRPDLVHVGPKITSLHLPSASDRLVGTSNGLGSTTTVAYRPSSSFPANNPVRGCHLPTGVVLNPVQSVLTSSQGARLTVDAQRYAYECARWSYTQRGLLSWEKVTVSHSTAPSRPAFTTWTRYQTYDVGIVQPVETSTEEDIAHGYVSPNWTRHSTSFIYAPVGNVPPYISVATGSREYQCSRPTAPCLVTQAAITPDEFGNTRQIVVEDPSTPSGVLRTTRIDYHPALGPYIVSLPSDKYVYAGLDFTQSPILSTSYCYDDDKNAGCRSPPTSGLLTATKRWNDQALQMEVTTYEYDRYGNQTKVTDPNLHAATMTYDDAYHTYPKTICNALRQCSTQTWNPATGLLEKDTDPNGYSTRFAYDRLGRVTSTEYPNGGKVTRSYLDLGDPTRQRVHERREDGSTDGLWTDTYLDGLGRRYRVVKPGSQPGVMFARDTTYEDASSQVYQQSHWYQLGHAAPRYEQFDYDAAGRLVTQQHPDGANLRWAHGNDETQSWVTSFDEQGHQKTLYSDANGRPTQLREAHNGTLLSTTYAYDAVDNLKTVTDNRGDVTTTTWDSLGRKLSTSDPDMGHWTYGYDDVGNLTSQTDARGQTTKFTYDALNRIATKQPNPPSGTTTVWTYDEPHHGAGIGRLTSISDPTGSRCKRRLSERRNYNSVGQVTSKSKCILGKVYTTTSGYDELGRLASVQYPNAEVVRYHYDAAGDLHRMSGYVDALSHNADGQFKTAEFANGTVEWFTYDPNRDWLTDASVERTGKQLYQATYHRDAGGLVKSTSSNTNKMNLGFTYDDLNRLLTVTGDSTQDFRYDDLGNMTYNSGIGTYTYPAAGPNGCGTDVACAGPHAVSSAGSRTYGYDADGNMTLRDGRQIAWNSDSQPEWIENQKGGWTRVLYDAWGDRVYQEYSSKGPGTQTPSGKGTYYYGPLMDYSSATGLTKYYYADSTLVARKDTTGTYWFHHDQLGSTRLLTNKHGAVAQRYDYQPFGERAAPLAAINSANDIGFAGQRTDEATGLIYMNARYYDPQLARFTSADSVVPDGFNSQALNRYSYVYNSPASYTDPTGHQPEDPIQSDPGEWAAWPYDPQANVSDATPPPLVSVSWGAVFVEEGATGVRTAHGTAPINAQGYIHWQSWQQKADVICRGDAACILAQSQPWKGIETFLTILSIDKLMEPLQLLKLGPEPVVLGIAALELVEEGAELGIVAEADSLPGDYLGGKAPQQVTPGVRTLEGQYVNDLGRVEPWRAHYDEYGRLIGRTDYNAGNATQGIPEIHYHTIEYNQQYPAGHEVISHAPGEYPLSP